MRRVAKIAAVWPLPSAILGFAVATLALVPAGRLPQVSKGGGALSVAFADARETISLAMLHKADSYFHGGVDVECHGRHEHGHEGHCHCSHEGGHGASREGGFDPWRWINDRVRAPERHVHLDGERAVELMPWFWAAVRADPHNIDAWTTAAYAAERMMKDRPLARRVLQEAKERNPESLEIAVAEARLAYDAGKGDVAGAIRLFEEAKALARRKCGGELSRLSGEDARACGQIDLYLSRLRGRTDEGSGR